MDENRLREAFGNDIAMANSRYVLNMVQTSFNLTLVLEMFHDYLRLLAAGTVPQPPRLQRAAPPLPPQWAAVPDNVQDPLEALGILATAEAMGVIPHADPMPQGIPNYRMLAPSSSKFLGNVRDVSSASRYFEEYTSA